MILLDPDLDPDPYPSRTNRAPTGPPSPTDRLPSARTVARFLTEAQAAIRLRGQVSVLLTTDAGIRRLNRQFRHKNSATDVLSFPAGGPGSDGIAGDLAVSVPTARRQAREQGHSLSTEIKVLILHGLLHLAGYDHEADEGQMARREERLRTRLRLPKGLIQRGLSLKEERKGAAPRRAAAAKKPQKRKSAGSPRDQKLADRRLNTVAAKSASARRPRGLQIP